MVPEWVLGAALCVTGGVLTSLGLTLQKHSHVSNARRPLVEQVSYVFQRAWRIGFVVYLCGQALGFVAMGFASQVRPRPCSLPSDFPLAPPRVSRRASCPPPPLILL